MSDANNVYDDSILMDPLLNEIGELSEDLGGSLEESESNVVDSDESLEESEVYEDLEESLEETKSDYVETLEGECIPVKEEHTEIESTEPIDIAEITLDDFVLSPGQSKTSNKSVVISSDKIGDTTENDQLELLNINIRSGEDLQKELIDPTKNDRLVASIKREEASTSIFNEIMHEIAEELAYLKNYRKSQFLKEEDHSDVSLKRVRGLRELVTTLVKREQNREKREGKIDFYGEKFEGVMKFILETISNVFEKAQIPDQYHDIFFSQLGRDLEGFEKKVEKIYYGK